MAILSKQETAVMQAVYELAHNKQSALFGLEDVMARVKPVRKFHKKSKHAPAENLTDAAALTDAVEGEPAPVESETVAAEEETAAASAAPKPKRSFWRRRREEDEPTDEDVPVKVYVDEPPVVKGMFEYSKPVRYEEIPHILEVLDMEEYIELTEAKADGEVKYVAELLSRGRRWERDEADRKRGALIKLGMTVATPILSFLLGILLRVLF